MASIDVLSPSQPNGPMATPIMNFQSYQSPMCNDFMTLTPISFNNRNNTDIENDAFHQNTTLDEFNQHADDYADSQPICNQEFYVTLDNVLYNQPRELYVEKLISLTKRKEDDISMYRNILLKRAQENDQCPNAPLIHRRTTKKEDSCTRYAQDCYVLQQFIYNGDPKTIIDIFQRTRALNRQDINSPRPESEIVSFTAQQEMSDLKSRVQLLTLDCKMLKNEKDRDKETIKQLKDELEEMKVYTAKLVETVNNQLSDQTKQMNNVIKSIQTMQSVQHINTTDEPRQTLNRQTTHNTEHSTHSLFKSIEAKRKLELSTVNMSSLDNRRTKDASTTQLNTSQNPAVTIQTQRREIDLTNETEQRAIGSGNIGTNRSYAEVLMSDRAIEQKKEETERNNSISVHITHREGKDKKHPNKYTRPIGKTDDRQNTQPQPQRFEGYMKSQDNRQTYNHEDTTYQSEPVFESVNSRKTRRYYVGNIAPYSNRAGILSFLKDNNVIPQTLKLIETKRGSLAAKISIYQHDWDKVETKYFWPKKVYCRRWYSQLEWDSMFYTTHEREQNNAYHSGNPTSVD